MNKRLIALSALLLTSIALAQTDTDGDGFDDEVDAFPTDPTEWLDTDGDGTGNNADADDDNDGRDDSLESLYSTDPLDDNDPPRARGYQYLVTPSTSQNITEVHIINSTQDSQQFRGTLYSADGERLSAANLPLSSSASPRNSRLVLLAEDLEQLLGVNPWAGPAILEVTSETPFELMSKLTSPSGLVSNTNCVSEDLAVNIEGVDSSDQTYVRLINTSETKLTDIKGTLYNSSGATIGDANTILIEELAPMQAVWLTRNDLSALLTEWSGEAMLVVEDLDGLKLLNLNFVNSETFFNFSCFEDESSGQVLLQTTSNSANISATHIINSSGSAQSYTGTLYDKSGTMLGTANTPLHSSTIDANERVILSSTELEQLFSIEPWSGPALLEVSGAGAFELMTKLTSPSGLKSNTNCSRQGTVHNVESPGSLDKTFIRFINSGSSTISTIKGTLYDTAGNAIGAADQVLLSDLAPNEARWLTSVQLADIVGSAWESVATLKVLGPDSLTLVNLNLVSSETFFNFSCFEVGGSHSPEFDETDVPSISVSSTTVESGETVTFSVTPGKNRFADPQGDTNNYSLYADNVEIGAFDTDNTLVVTPPFGTTDYKVVSESGRDTGVTADGNTITVTAVTPVENDNVASIIVSDTRNTNTVFVVDEKLAVQVIGPDPASSTGTCEVFQNDVSLGTFPFTPGGVGLPSTHSLSGLQTFLQANIGAPGSYIFETWDTIEAECTTTNSTGGSSTYPVFTNNGNHFCSSGCVKNN